MSGVLSRRPRTIQIYLPSGDPSGIRQAELTTSIVRVFEVPRNQVSEFLAMPESSQVGLYFLVGGEDLSELYIGQSGNVGHRLGQHNKDSNKEWDRALVVVSLTQNLTQTHVLYLESVSIEKAKRYERYKLINGNSGSLPYTPKPLQADCEDIHETAALLLTTLGYPIFEPLIADEKRSDAEKLFCTRAGTKGEGYYTNEGMVVLKGSEGRLNPGGKIRDDIVRARDRLIDAGVMGVDGERTVMLKDHLFKTPSAASCALLAAASNGWIDWKTSNGRTLSDIERTE